MYGSMVCSILPVFGLLWLIPRRFPLHGCSKYVNTRLSVQRHTKPEGLVTDGYSWTTVSKILTIDTLCDAENIQHE